MLALLTLFVLFGGLLAIHLFIKQLPGIKSMENVPGPKHYPIIGCFFVIFRGPVEIFKVIRTLSKTYPKIYKMHVINQAGVLPLLPDDIETLLTSMSYIKKSRIYDPVKAWLNNGLLTSFGTKWRTRRKILTPAFHFNILQEFVTIFEEHSKQVVERLRPECNKEQTEITPIITEFALSALCETAMGTPLSSEAGALNYKSAIHRFGELTIRIVISPWLWLHPVATVSPTVHEMRKVLQILHSFTRRIISERKKNFIQVKQVSNDEVEVIGSSKKRLAMLDLLLSAHKNGRIDEAGIKEEVDTFMFEGHDTTSVALNFALMILANHPDVQEKIYNEVEEILGTSDGLATIQDLQQMRYLDQCLKESLRLYPSVPLIARDLVHPITLANLTFPPGVTVALHIFDIHRNPEIWEDPERFDPDRFLTEKCVGRHPFAYIPFSAGPRNCIGQKFAMLEMKSVVSNIIRNYKMEAVTRPGDIVFIADLVLRATEPIKIKFHARN